MGLNNLGDLSRDVVVRSLFYEKLKKYYDYEESMNEIQKQYENTHSLGNFSFFHLNLNTLYLYTDKVYPI